jgi:hypothetical protein
MKSRKKSPKKEGRARGEGRSLWLMVVYYVVLIGLAVILARMIPAFEDALTLRWLDQAFQRTPEISETLTGREFVGMSLPNWDRYGIGVALFSVLGSIAVMVPVAWTYIIIKRPGDYDQSVVHTLLILPVAVTSIVLIVQNSLALAFSLAGIVAAVRFRTTLEDTKDAVYVFLAIGVGLAAGAFALALALAFSMAFNALSLVLWRQNFGNIYADQIGRTRALALGDVVAGPGSAGTAVSIGDKRLLSALTPRELTDVADKAARIDRYLEAEADTLRDRKQFSVLMVYVDKVGLVQQVVEHHLADMAIRWRLAEILPGEEGVQILEYLVRMKETIPPGMLLDAIREEAGEHIRAAEFRSLKGLRKRS